MAVDPKGVYTQFQKTELLEIADELEVSLPHGARSPEIVTAIFADIEKQGVPETDDDSCSDLLFQFLVTAEYIDENGNLIEEEKKEEVYSEEDLPPCFSYADERDPACQGCKVFTICLAKRVESRPPCFGKLFKETDEQCKLCLEALPCSLIVLKLQKG